MSEQFQGAGVAAGKPDPGAGLGLGAYVCTRSSQALYWIVAVVFGGMALFVGPLGVVAMFGRGRGAVVGGLITLAVGLLLAGVAALCVRQARTSIRFYELGAARFLGTKPKVVIAWVEACELTYKVIKQYYNGIPIGTNVTIQIRTDDNRKISFTGGHKTKVKSKKLFGPKEVVAVDELDYVRDMVAEVVADRMGDKLLAREPVEWAGSATLTDEGLTPRRGRYKRELVPYSEIDREAANEGSLSLYRAGDERSFLTVPMAAANFWPGAVLLHRMIGAALPPGAEEVIVEEGSRSEV